MTIHSATDHGFHADPPSRGVERGDIFRLRSAEALYDVRVSREHRDAGYWEVVFLNGPRQGAIHVMHDRDILAALHTA